MIGQDQHACRVRMKMAAPAIRKGESSASCIHTVIGCRLFFSFASSLYKSNHIDSCLSGSNGTQRRYLKVLKGLLYPDSYPVCQVVTNNLNFLVKFQPDRDLGLEIAF